MLGSVAVLRLFRGGWFFQGFWLGDLPVEDQANEVVKNFTNTSRNEPLQKSLFQGVELSHSGNLVVIRSVRKLLSPFHNFKNSWFNGYEGDRVLGVSCDLGGC